MIFLFGARPAPDEGRRRTGPGVAEKLLAAVPTTPPTLAAFFAFDRAVHRFSPSLGSFITH